MVKPRNVSIYSSWVELRLIVRITLNNDQETSWKNSLLL
ncbi:hypothetical protein PT7_1719 [Pusillimonas sp. T7-7]|nr:hypothetical protein PT7_1719 [Pusillimonas sp. T7-7]